MLGSVPDSLPGLRAAAASKEDLHMIMLYHILKKGMPVCGTAAKACRCAITGSYMSTQLT